MQVHRLIVPACMVTKGWTSLVVNLPSSVAISIDSTHSQSFRRCMHRTCCYRLHVGRHLLPHRRLLANNIIYLCAIPSYCYMASA